MKYTTSEIATAVAGDLRGSGAVEITSLAELSQAGPGQLTFLGDARYLTRWQESSASATLVSESLTEQVTQNTSPDLVVIFVASADLAMAKVLEMFAPPAPPVQPGVHPSAVVDPTARLGADVAVGALAYVGPHAMLGDGCVLHPQSTVMDEAVLGAGCVLWPGAVVRERCELGERCVLHAGAIIGGDGFGYRPGGAGDAPLVKVPQIGKVVLGADCEIGANAAIDRAKFDVTELGQGCKIDNLVQIGHNCRLGDYVIIAGCTAVAGSCTIGSGTVIGGGADIADHLTIGSGVQLGGGAQLMNDIPDGETWGGSPAGPLKQKIKEEIAIRKLPDLIKQVKHWQKQLEG